MQGASQAGLPHEGGGVVDELRQPVGADEVSPKVKQPNVDLTKWRLSKISPTQLVKTSHRKVQEPHQEQNYTLDQRVIGPPPGLEKH